MNIENLLSKRQELENELNIINRQINNYEDGFDYVVCVHSYGSHCKYKFNNLYAAMKLIDEYNQDNGFVHLYTNNPNLKISLNSGDVYFIKDTSIVSPHKHPEKAVKVM